MGNLSARSYWKCRLYDRGGCKARCSMRMSDIVLSRAHNHLPETDKLKNRRVLKCQKLNVYNNNSDGILGEKIIQFKGFHLLDPLSPTMNDLYSENIK